MLGERIEQCNQSQSIQLDMADMLHEQVMKPSYAPSDSLANSHRPTFEGNHSIIMNYCDERSILSNKADVNFHAEMQKCDELSVQPSYGATIYYSQSMEIIPKNHTAAAITLQTAQAEGGIIYPMFDSGCSTVLTSSMLNCREVKEHVMSIMQAESGVKMSSTHKCRKTC